MNRITRTSFTLGLLVLCMLTVPSSSSGQSVWLDPTVESSLSLEILKPDFQTYGYYGSYRGDKVKLYSSVWFLTVRGKVTGSTSLLFELPTAHYDATRTYQDYGYGYGGYSYYEHEIDGQSMVGNPFVGIEHSSPGSSFFLLFGARVPMAGEAKDYEANFAAITEISRFEAFLQDVFTLKLRLGARSSGQRGLIYHFFGELDHLIPANKRAGDERSYLGYGGQLWLTSEKVRMGGGLIGRLWLGNKRNGFGESSFHQFGFSASFGSGRVRPGVHLRVPLDDDLPGLQFVWGLNLQIKLGDD